MASDKSSVPKKNEPPRPPDKGTGKAPPAAPQPSPAPRSTVLARSRTNIWLAGVCGGLGAFLPVPAWAWRCLFLLAPLFIGLFAFANPAWIAVLYSLATAAYVALWIVLKPEPAAVNEPPPMFRPVDWLTMGLTTLLVFGGYLYTIAPDLTLEDSGELAVASLYAGVPHPPGYPVWTIYTWFFTVILPFSNIAWRVAVGSAFAGAASCGLIALMVSRGSSMMLEGIKDFKDIDRRWENAICAVSGYVAGMLMGFNGFFWSQAVIVEVYTLSVFSLTGVLACLLRWLYAPEQRRFVYWALFLFGICFTNHQTLVVAAVGIEVLILMRDPKLGRDLFLGNSVIYVLGLFYMAAKAQRGEPMTVNPIILRIFHVVGVGSLLTAGFMTLKTRKFLTEWKPVLIMGLVYVAGVAFYLYMPVASMTNPPLNWGYPRTVEGFKHALTRGQYESARPTSEALLFFKQMILYAQGAMEEFNEVYILFALVPFVFLLRMQNRERSWIIGLSAIYLCLAVLLVILLNPQPDRQSLQLNRVFFTSSHVMIAMGIGYGLTIIAGLILTHYQWFRGLALACAGVWTGWALYQAFALESLLPIYQYAAVFALGLAVLTVIILAVFRAPRTPIALLLVVFCLMPVHSVLSHWWENEQRGHLFGFWFGHDMFTPPFVGPDGKLTYDSKLRAEMRKDPEKAKLIYPEMEKDTILFGGTDPGRFNPTYMIFCEGFIKPEHRRNPEFDRRDVYIITQNALADGTYLAYIRAHYNRSAQQDPPFFQELLRSPKERTENIRTNLLARAARSLDDFFIRKGEEIEARRRAELVYPPKEILTPTPQDSEKAFNEYVTDAGRRAQLNQLRPGEDVKIDGNRLSVSGQVAVMAINALLTKVIFDKNPNHEFYVEESFPLDWMYPYLTPSGIIMKINRQPLVELSDEIVRRDQHFWSTYSERLIGNWINDQTSVKEICDFAERVYVRGDFTGFKGDPKFIRDDNAQKAFSKLRSAIGGLYTWRINHCSAQMQAILTKPPEQQAPLAAERARLQNEQNRMVAAADFAFRQSLAYCPYSPEAVFRYINLLTSIGRFDDALLIVGTAKKLDPENVGFKDLYDNLAAIKARGAAATQPQFAPGQPPQPAQPPVSLQSIETEYNANPSNINAVAQLASAYWQLQRTNDALGVVKRYTDIPGLDPLSLANAAQIYIALQRGNEAVLTLDRAAGLPNVDANSLTAIAQLYGQLGQIARLEAALKRLVTMIPESPEAWYDLAAIQAAAQKNPDAAGNLQKAFQMSDQRRAKAPKERDLRSNALTDARFQLLRQMPEHKALFQKQ
jgi:tetratricopeptide (TPR) repeat protein/phage shock protein PspC (stress-responsive transcriptional regulator)